MRQLKIWNDSIIFFVLLFFATFCNYLTEAETQWSYTGKNGPSNWGEMCAVGQAQSPVNLENQVYEKNLKANPLVFKGYDEKLMNSELTNNGHTLKLSLKSEEGKSTATPAIPAEISGGGLNGTYHFAQLHFHWGQTSNSGSEHWMYSETFPLEVHLVHYNKKYGSLAKAAAKPDGLAVLGTFFHIQKEDNSVFSDLTKKLQQIQEPNEISENLSGLSLASFIPPMGSKTTEFFRYEGSLTTPGCYESVTWTVFRHSLAISEEQMASFRALYDGQGQPLVNNFRPVQPLNGRSILVSFDDNDVKVNYGFDPRITLDESATTDKNEVENLYGDKKYGAKKYDKKAKIPADIDHFFLLVMSVIIFFMQCGFAFMEAGAVRSKNTVNILIKNWLDMCIGAVVYWAFGFGLTFGTDQGRFIGTTYFFFHEMADYKFSKWFFQFVFAATAATLVSGSLAERCNFYAYLLYSVMITGFIYPVIAHWAWHPEGWLNINGFHDFAGSAVVHLTGAVCALVGCVLMGPRIGRFDRKGQPVSMPGHSVPLSALGGLILVFGFFACNGTKQGSISNPGDGVAIATAIVNTALGTSVAGLSTLLLNKTGLVPGTGHHFSFLLTMNGSLTGTVALCAGCNIYPTWAAFVVGAIAGPLFLLSNWLLVKLKIDDPLDAIPVHGAGGLWGTLAVHFFKKDGIFVTGSSAAAMGLAWNIIGLIAIISWTGILSFVMFYALKKVKMLRVEASMEFSGMDILKHGESAYPADAWVEQQYMKEEINNVQIPGTPNLPRQDSTDTNITSVGAREEVSRKTSTLSLSSKNGLPPHMKYSRSASYNNPHEMFPSESKLFTGMTQLAGNITVNIDGPKTVNGLSMDCEPKPKSSAQS